MLRVRQIKVKVLEDTSDNLLKCLAKKLNTNISNIKKYSIKKQSLDARDKSDIYFVYEVDVELKDYNKIKLSFDVSESKLEEYKFVELGNNKLNNRPIIVGSGPAGLFCAYMLAEAGYNPLIIERGERVEDRVNTVSKFWNEGILNPNSNVQFGEGGAGTFSDGKLNTMVKDTSYRNLKVLETFVKFGAYEDILYSYKPHIGTDVLVDVVKNMREFIISKGGEFRYNTCLTDINYKDNKLTSIIVNNNKKIDCDVLVLAIGHSSRDTFNMLYNKLEMEAKPFSVGLRVMHNQDMIDSSQYGMFSKVLNKATYKLTYTASNSRGVYSFCMCPGGYVVNASSEENRLAINGMSYHDRNSGIANSAIVVTVFPRDFGNNPLDGIKFQRTLEEKAYEIGKGNIPIQRLIDYNRNVVSTSISNIAIKGKYTLSNLNLIFPDYINDSIKEAFTNYGRKIKGFDNDDAVLAGVESRTSSPVRIYRDDYFESNIKGIYPCGEGAGYAGGITSAAMDGIKVSEAIASKYSPKGM